MKSFGKRLIPFILGTTLFGMLGWYQANFHAMEGDLVRSSYLITNRHYSDPVLLPPSRDTTARKILLVGDSHLNQSPSSRRFQNYMDIEVSSNSCWAYESPRNPFTLGVALATQRHPDLVVLEVVERNLIKFAREFLQLESIPEPEIPIATPKKRGQPLKHIGNGARTAASLLNIRHKWLQNDQCRVLPCSKKPPLHSPSSLFLTKNVWANRKPSHEVTPILDQLKQSLADLLNPKGIDFFIYIIPDKATVYNDFIDPVGLPPSFLLEAPLPTDVYSPLAEMRKAVNAGTMEVFKYSDTHLGEAGAQIAGTHLNEIIQSWTENQSY